MVAFALSALSQTYNLTTDYDVNTTAAAGVSVVVMLFWLAIVVVALIGAWKVFEKAGKPGWAALIPIYNTYILLQIIGEEPWKLILTFIPFVNIVMYLLWSIKLGAAFGKSSGWSVVLLFLLSPIGYLILGFGKDQFHGSTTATTAAPTTPAAPSAPTPPATPATPAA